MNNRKHAGRYDNFVNLGTSGSSKDVDTLMSALITRSDIATSKLVDYALSLVNTREGKQRLRYFLFHGLQAQRNFAALYFKRRGDLAILEQAVTQGKIDHQQAYSK
ncbi:MAG: hypothetical protein P8074_07235 [Anaerolineales bacterium]|jgi:hypothetical protein